jgi:hypothetical protein
VFKLNLFLLKRRRQSFLNSDKALKMNIKSYWETNLFTRSPNTGSMRVNDTIFSKRESIEKSSKKVRKDTTPSIEENDDIPSPTEIITAVAPKNEVERIERASQPPPIKKRTLDLLGEGRQRDLIEKDFIPHEQLEKQLGPRKLNFNPS